MINLLKIELKRAFCNRLFLISTLIGCTIIILHICLEVIPLTAELKILPGGYILSVFNQWIGLSTSFYTTLFFSVFPLLAAIPFADSFFTDRKYGFIKNILTRTNKKNYYLSEFISVFLSGGSAVIIPLVLDLYLTSLFFPTVIPDISSGIFPLFSNSTWATLYYTKPFYYVILYLLLIFVASGLLTSLALAFSFIIKFRYIVIISPFLSFLGIIFLSMLIKNPAVNIEFWINPQQTVPMQSIYVISEMLIFLLTIIVGYFIRGKRDEIY